MPPQSEQFRLAIEKIDAANADDPQKINGVPAEVLYARRMSDWLEHLYPDAGEALHLAARAQHIRRWTIPRSTFPMTRAGYHRWRKSLYTFHADATAEILRSACYSEPVISRVRSLLKKENLHRDPEMQMLEDVICLVFLESYFADFASKHDEQKVIDILRKTWKKMSEKGREAALSLKLEPHVRRLVEKAVG